jgi:hypothetical protein
LGGAKHCLQRASLGLLGLSLGSLITVRKATTGLSLRAIRVAAALVLSAIVQHFVRHPALSEHEQGGEALRGKQRGQRAESCNYFERNDSQGQR